VVANGTYRRSFEVGGEAGWFEVANGARNALRLDIDVAQAAQLLPIVSRVRRLFDLDADPMAIDTQLAADPLLAPLVARRPGLRVPGAWDGFELAVRAILGQQVSVAAATTLAGRLVARFGRPLEADAGGAERAGAPGRTEKTEGGERQAGRVTHLFPSPEALARGRIADIGLPRRRADAVRAFAEAVAGGDLSFDGALDPVVFRARARGVPGIGDWTAEYIALRALGDPDAFPAGDLGLLRATGLVSARRLAERARAWQPWRAYAALHLWTDGHSRRTD
jgi:3-methyladenine DNA glycosylase/8-oxoguanine DNA glycosylase